MDLCSRRAIMVVASLFVVDFRGVTPKARDSARAHPFPSSAA
jgi:hypothetical protein